MSDETTIITTGRFVRKGFILRDLLLAMQADEPSVNAEALHEALAIEQNCDYEQQLLSAFTSTSEFSLPAYIRQYVRNNASDNTDLPSMERFYVNPVEAALNSSALMIQRITDAAVPILKFTKTTRPSDFLATKANPWTHDQGVFTFTRKANLQINFSFSAAMNVADTAAEDLAWRYSDSGTNRVVTVTPVLHIEGALSTGARLDMQLGSVAFFPEHYARDVRLPIQGGVKIPVLDNAGNFGRIDKMSVSLHRSTWIAQNAAGAYDRVLLPKRTGAGTLDQTNYVELMEI